MTDADSGHHRLGSQERLQELANMAAIAIGALALATLLLSLAAGYVVSRLIRRPTRQLIKSAADLKKGNMVRFEPTIMREANVVGKALADASRDIQLYMREISHRSKKSPGPCASHIAANSAQLCRSGDLLYTLRQ